MSKLNILIPDAKSMEELGASLAQNSKAGSIIFLQGNLGAGKTTLVRGFLRGLGYQGKVKSPTYTLVEEYDFEWGSLYHFDLYRVVDSEELNLIGIREYFKEEAIVLVEWPEQGKEILPKADLLLTFDILDTDRQVSLHANTLRGQQIMKELYV